LFASGFGFWRYREQKNNCFNRLRNHSEKLGTPQ
jgi:hypothetical protein